MNFLLLSVLIYGVMSFKSLQPATHFEHAPSLLQMYKKNPAKFMEEMSKVDPDRVSEIIGLLQGLLEESEGRQATIEQELQDASDNLGEASNNLLDAEDALTNAVSARETAENVLATSEGVRDEAQIAHDTAVQIHDDQVDGLNGEVQVLRDVVAMLQTLLPSGSGWSEFSRDVACEGNGAGRDSACDVANGGGIECCQGSAEERGFQFVVWWADKCYATTTCDNPYDLVDTVNYHNEGASLISVAQVSNSPDAGDGGRRLLSLESDIIKNPKKFVAKMSKADPGAVQNIIDMLLALIADNENTVADLIHQVETTQEALNAASAQVVTDQEGLESAQGDESAAELALSEAQAAEASAQSARNEAQGVFDGEIDTLSNEQQVLREVIALLESLIPSGGSGWSEFSRDVACEGNGAGRDSACDVANGGGIECCQASALANGFQFVVWWADQCYATTTCDNPYNLVNTVNYHHSGSSLVSVTRRSSAHNAGD